MIISSIIIVYKIKGEITYIYIYICCLNIVLIIMLLEFVK